jgi:hypothetical protein
MTKIQTPKSRQNPKQACSSCRFFVPEGEGGFCYRFPPQAINTMQSTRPSTKADWWCGEWEKWT